MSNPARSGHRLINGPLDGASKDLVTFVNDAVQLVAQQGEAAFGEFRHEGGRWRGSGSYIFVLDLRGNVLVHPDPAMEGTNQLKHKRGEGNPHLRRLIRAFSAFSEKPDKSRCYTWIQEKDLLPQLEACYMSLVQAPSGNCFLIGSGIDAGKGSNLSEDKSGSTQ